MPQLSTGRPFVVSLDPVKYALVNGSDAQRYSVILAYRLQVRGAPDLLSLASIGYFTQDGAGPPAGETESAGFTAGAVLEGDSDWSANEVAEFRAWIEGERVQDWLADEFALIHALIENNPVWTSELLPGE